MRTDQNKNKRQNVIGNSLLLHDKADFSVGQYGLHHRAAHRDLLRQISDFHFEVTFVGQKKYYAFCTLHCRRNGSNLFQITADAHPGVSGVSKDQKFCEKFKNTHCQVDHPAKIE